MSLTRTMRFLIAGLVATIAMGMAVSSATASTGASVTNGVTLASANGPLTLSAGGLNIICNVTLGLSLNQSIAKSAGATIGTVLPSGSGSTISGCNLGVTGIVLSGITVQYTSFIGTLPNIAAINGATTNAAFELNIPAIGSSCLYTGSVNAQFVRASSGAITRVGLSSRNSLNAPSPCPSPGSLNGPMTVQATQPVVQLI